MYCLFLGGYDCTSIFAPSRLFCVCGLRLSFVLVAAVMVSVSLVAKTLLGTVLNESVTVAVPVMDYQP